MCECLLSTKPAVIRITAPNKGKPGGNSAPKPEGSYKKKQISSRNYSYSWRLTAQVSSGPLLA